ncbi:hypothetical protein LTR36_005728 [Oleoguttula mirabilis]|uniref:1,3-beta-glucanosyltransferase n=1 Tax=Oleoguttula mirabilis TaxID=1507867 RepID=A0AAV9JDT2_9PEZI|nr:hypothetical protein LTR36_005728 [Oleoguttula mirabilis]
MLVSVAAGLLGLATQAVALSTIAAKGSKFFLSTGEQFYNKGVAYQLTDSDPLADTQQCQLDAALMKTLGANSIRVYHVDPTADHDGCMSAFSDAGIYAWIDLDTFSTYILADEPTWNQTQYSAYQKVMDAFHDYENVAGFFVGNEVLTIGTDSVAAPYVKAAARDMKAYRDNKGYRDIPVGYSAADIAQLRPNLQNYMACGDNSSESLDFFSLNAYEWCGSSSYDVSGYVFLQQNASDYNIPIFFSETGCNTPAPRLFQDQAAIFGDDMSGTWSGAIIYEWIEEANNYGLISYGPSAAATATETGVVGGYTRSGTPTPISPDFDNLSSQWATLSPSGVSMAAYSPSNTPPACPSYTSGLWELSGNVPLPTIGQKFNTQSASATATSGASTAQSTGSGSGTATSAGSSSGSASSASSTASSAAIRPRNLVGSLFTDFTSHWYGKLVAGLLILVVL